MNEPFLPLLFSAKIADAAVDMCVGLRQLKCRASPLRQQNGPGLLLPIKMPGQSVTTTKRAWFAAPTVLIPNLNPFHIKSVFFSDTLLSFFRTERISYMMSCNEKRCRIFRHITVFFSNQKHFPIRSGWPGTYSHSHCFSAMYVYSFRVLGLRVGFLKTEYDRI